MQFQMESSEEEERKEREELAVGLHRMITPERGKKRKTQKTL